MDASIVRTAPEPAANGFGTARNCCLASRRTLMRLALGVVIGAGTLIVAPHRNAQEGCSQEPKQGCFAPVKRDLAFIIDRSGSIAKRGQTYNIEIEGVLRALRDPTAIPRDGSVAVAVITFAEDARIVAPLTVINSTADAEGVAAKVAAIKCADVSSEKGTCPFGATSYTAAIITADAHLNQNRREGARRVLLISTDGEPTDPDLGVEAANQARIAALLTGLTSELDVILMGLESQELIDINKAKVDQIVFPQPASDLPGKTLLLSGGESNRPDALPDTPDFSRQADDYSDLARSILRSDVAPLSMVVTTQADLPPDSKAVPSGPLTLRQAIELANCNGGKATITFSDEVKGRTIRPLVPLPSLTAGDVTIDACDGPDCAPGVTINGAATDIEGGEAHPNGLLIRSGRNVVRGLRIVNFPGAGIAIDRICPLDAVGRNRVEHNALENNAHAGALVADTLSEGKESFNVRNSISRNSISNSATPIDLNGDGPTANDTGDPDPGPNTLLNFADSINVVAADGKVNVSGQTNGPTTAEAKIELFAVTDFAIVSGKLVIKGASFLTDTTTGPDGSFIITGAPTSASGIYTVSVTDRPGNTSELMSETGNTKPAVPGAGVPGGVGFGDVPVNTTPPSKPVEVTNNGNAPLIITGCSIVKCNSADRDDTSLFMISGCPTGPLNPGEHVTINVTVKPTRCGAIRACLKLDTNDPKNPNVLIPLTANVNGAAQAKLTLQGNASALEFATVNPRGKPRKVKIKKTRTFTIENTGCETLNIVFGSLVRTGPDVGSKISNPDDRGLYSITRINGDGSESPVPIGPPTQAVQIAGQQQVTFRVRFTPVIPAVATGTSGLSASQVIPDTIRSTLNISQNSGPALAVNLVGQVATDIRLIDPDNPSAPPLVTVTRAGNQFTVRFSAFDSNLNISRATYQFLDSAGRQVDQTFDVDLTQSVRDRGLVRGQSFTVEQNFTGGGNAGQVNRVQVTVFDGEVSDSATSGGVTTSSTLGIRTSGQNGGAEVVLPPLRRKRINRE